MELKFIPNFNMLCVSSNYLLFLNIKTISKCLDFMKKKEETSEIQWKIYTSHLTTPCVPYILKCPLYPATEERKPDLKSGDKTIMVGS